LPGGAITVITRLIASHWGPVVEGLVLAFPAIFSSGATLIISPVIAVINIAMFELA